MANAIPTDPDVVASVALSIATALAQKLILKGIFTKDEVVELYETLAAAKRGKADANDSDIESQAAVLLEQFAEVLKKA